MFRNAKSHEHYMATTTRPNTAIRCGHSALRQRCSACSGVASRWWNSERPRLVAKADSVWLLGRSHAALRRMGDRKDGAAAPGLRAGCAFRRGHALRGWSYYDAAVAWRAVPSHFNRASPFDATVLGWIEWLIFFVTLFIAEITRRSLYALRAGRDMALAIRSGMVLLLFSCVLGFVLVAYGNYRISQGHSPEVYPPAGVMKFPHGVPMHAIQILPLTAWIMTKLHVGAQQRHRAVAATLVAVLAFTLYSLLQTFTGRARFAMWWPSAPVLVLSVTCIAVPVYLCVGGLVRTVFRDQTRG